MSKKDQKITRRKFVNTGAKGYAGIHLTAALPAGLLAAAGRSAAEA